MQVDRWNPELRRWLDQASRQAGFDVVGVAEVRGPHDPAAAQEAARFEAWIDSGRAGEMDYLKRRDQSGMLLRGNLRVAIPWARSAIVCAMSYNFAAPFIRSEDQLPRAAPPLSIHPAPPGSGWIARYAWTGRPLDDGHLGPHGLPRRTARPPARHRVSPARPRHMHHPLLRRHRPVRRTRSGRPGRRRLDRQEHLPHPPPARLMAPARRHRHLTAGGAGKGRGGRSALRIHTRKTSTPTFTKSLN